MEKLIRNYFLILLTIVCILLTPYNMQGQGLKITCTQLNEKVSSDKLDQQFKAFTLFATDYNKSLKSLKETGQMDISLNIEGWINERISLTERNLLSKDYKSNKLSNIGLIEQSVAITKNYKGNIIGDPTSEIRVALDDNMIHGYIKRGSETIWIEPANSFDKSLTSNTMVAYYEKDVIITKKSTCASTKMHQQKTKTDKQVKSAGSCIVTRMSILMDYSYVTDTDHNSYAAAVNQTVYIMNLVEGNYSGAFDVDIEFEIVEHLAPISARENDVVFGSSLNASVLLNRFTSWAPGGFENLHDIGQFWTSQNLYYLQNSTLGDIPSNRSYGVAGLAWVNSICNGYRYHIIEEYTNSDWQLRVLVAHEIGHNFGSGHDNTNGNIMAGSISLNTNSWSDGSKTSINNALGNFNCLEECLVGSCTEISSVLASDCTPGSPATYDLSAVIEHSGGGTSTGFYVHVDGRSYTFDWKTSPQTITIEDLLADDAVGNIVSISANDESDIGCEGSATYDVPDGTCSLSEKEDFNDCSLPVGWESLTDNKININNGDPRLQYKWKFDDSDRYLVNYGAAENAETNTIDGTCMALMDDDIINQGYYQGIVTLVTPSYNTLAYEAVTVKFDYNFHPFEDSKLPNESYFHVNVWDGEQYVNILTDTEATCPWHNVWEPSCIDSESINVSQYSNGEMHFQFVYSDGKNAKWTGMIALDNFEITGNSIPSAAPCPTVFTLTDTNVAGSYEAASMIQTSGSVSINSNIQLNAPSIRINSRFEIMGGAELSLMNEGCNNTTE